MSVEELVKALTGMGVPRVIVCGYGPLGLGLLNGVLYAQAEGLCELVGIFRWCARTPTMATLENLAEKWFAEDAERDFAARCHEVCQTRGVIPIHAEGINSYAFTAMMSRLKANVILVGSWGEIIGSHVLERPDILVINCHPSLLPKHRGANPYVSVVRAGEERSGITFHRMVKTIDGGPILLQRELVLSPTDTGGSVRNRCAALAQDAVPDLLRQVAHPDGYNVHALGTEQDDRLKSSYPSPKDRDGRICWEQNATQLSSHVRAFEPWIFVYSYWQQWLKVIFVGARVKRCEDTVECISHRKVDARWSQSGMFLHRAGQRLIVATADQELVLDVSEFYLGVAGLNLPVWLSVLLAVFCFAQAGTLQAIPFFLTIRALRNPKGFGYNSSRHSIFI